MGAALDPCKFLQFSVFRVFRGPNRFFSVELRDSSSEDRPEAGCRFDKLKAPSEAEGEASDTAGEDARAATMGRVRARDVGGP